ncbi:ALF repeat-containing protein, partial [Streptomyces monomycini]|uniref:ALF repeat-containing protein n=2 Tax=Streptomyces monomycini TaxID=371720 RepID=UPI001EEA6104
MAGLLGTGPAIAAESADPGDAARRRSLVLDYWTVGGAGVKAAAEQALTGSDEDVDRFFAEKGSLAYDDNYVVASRMIGAGGPAVREAAKTALKASKRDNPEPLSTFLQDGWQAPLRQDNEVEASKVINFGGYG